MKKADEIKYKLMGYAKNNPSDIVLANWFEGSWEMDVMRITNTDFIYEYEIKISRADFKNDFNKVKHSWNKTSLKKHDEIVNGNRCNRFFFVVPENLVSVSEIPDYAGLIYYTGSWFRVVKNAKLIHNKKYEGFKSVAHKLSFRNTDLQYKVSQFQKEKTKNSSFR